MAPKEWTVDEINQLVRQFQPSCVLAAAAELDLFHVLASGSSTAAEAARKLQADLRSLTILLDALAALQLLDKQGERYLVPASVAQVLTDRQPGNQLAMVQHLANCLRRWAQLATVVKTGTLPPPQPSIRGQAADYASFIEAMDNVSGPVAGKLVAELPPLHFQHLLDVGGGSGTWTLAFLRAHPTVRATLFDLPQVMAQAQERITKAGFGERVTLVAGDFYSDPLPRGADLAWVSAIVHQNSRAQNWQLFARLYEALMGGGQVLIRDILMDPSRTTPVAGALFAVNMLANTEQGGTFTFEELRDDLAAAGFTNVQVLRRDEGMHSIISASKP
jgi:predicted O-methyltransferase YrrM